MKSIDDVTHVEEHNDTSNNKVILTLKRVRRRGHPSRKRKQSMT